MKPLETQNYRNIVVLTGAGVSAASGLSTFRGPDGKWQHELLAVSDGRRIPELLPEMWLRYGKARAGLLNVEPNIAHFALADWQKKWGDSRQITLVTQNVDGLHQKAGSPDVIEIHGSLLETRCINSACTSKPFLDLDVPESVPICAVCGSFLRPNITLFHEALPLEAITRVKLALRDCDLFLSIGTSGVVAPASDFVRAAAYAGARTIYLNLTPLDAASPFQENIVGRAEEILPDYLG
ncbi:NAD-dependent deacetylase [Abditibacterium utsteinense]|uniref:protein acetyllysine N-acetyltransferase n=1 Tax=Abditibacterium utsteinense TaxID=1960156 RepID=A0A2S8SUZ1_9BACT|nr:Sir2 family NAD-dependent protein deacetylase [Abditibacterium utsteinense]PQV64610.1 NAD-dependent deacetylase [Abditibacterium utsteinense]